MAIFTALTWAASALMPGFAGSLSLFGMSPGLTAAVISVGRSALWSLAGALLMQPKVPRQSVQATLNQTDAPRIRAYGRNLLGGQRAFFEADDGRLHQVVVMHQGAVDGLIQFWIDGEQVTTEATPPVADGGGRVNRYKAVYFLDGSGEGGDYAGVFAGESLGWEDLTEAFPTLWTAQHRLQNQATFYAVFGDPSDEDFQENFPKGAYTVVQAEVRGSRVRNMAGDLIYSENAGLIIRDFMTHPDGWGMPASRMDNASWGQFAALCGEGVPLAAGGAESRYRICGFYTLDDQLKDVASRMLAACDGQVYETADGNVGILGGAWSEPDVTITDADILSIQLTDGFDPFTDYNVLNASFVSPAHNYQSTPVMELRDDAAVAEFGAISDQMDVDMVPSGTQLQRLMKIKYAKDHREYTGTIRTNLVGMKARYPKGDGIHTIRIVSEEFGLNRVFEVTGHVFSIPDGYCEISVATLKNPYGWSTAQERQIPPDVASLGTPDNTQAPPTGAAVVQQQVTVSGGVVGAKLVVTVTDPGRDGLRLQAQVAPGTHAANSTAAAWVEMASQGYRAETGILDDGQAYTVRIKWRGRSAWVVAGVVTIIANPAVPPAPTSLSAVYAGGQVALGWRNASTGFYRTQILRHTSNVPGSATVIANVIGVAGQVSSYEDTPPGSGIRYYWARTINPSGVPSAYAGPVTVTLP